MLPSSCREIPVMGVAATCGYLERSILLWNLETGKEVRRIDANDTTAAVTDICFSPDCKLLARAGVDQVDLWDVASGKKLVTGYALMALSYCQPK